TTQAPGSTSMARPWMAPPPRIPLVRSRSHALKGVGNGTRYGQVGGTGALEYLVPCPVPQRNEIPAGSIGRHSAGNHARRDPDGFSGPFGPGLALVLLHEDAALDAPFDGLVDDPPQVAGLPQLV